MPERKIGAPLRRPEQKYSANIRVVMTPALKATVERLAAKSNVGISDYIRHLIQQKAEEEAQ